jgi:histidyl-tRNA synthetase
LILMLRALWRDLGLVEGRDVRLEINSLGQVDERQTHRAALIAHFEANAGALDEEGQRRLHSNPLRLLDSKHPAMQPVIEAAPRLLDFLGAASLAHFDALRATLDAAGLPYRINPRLVRGIDYYNLTVFEWVTERLGAQGTVCGGGRYDGLIAQLGGKAAPGVGFGLGVERLLLLLEEVGIGAPIDAPDVYAIVPDMASAPQVIGVLETLRGAGVNVLMHAGGGSIKSQFKRADASGARHALVFGTDELAQGMVGVKALRTADGTPGTQTQRPLAEAGAWAASLLPA